MKIRVLFLLTLTFMTAVSCSSNAVSNNKLSDAETNTLNEIAPSLSPSNIILLKEKGYLSEFITLLENEYTKAKTEHISSITPQLELWNLSLDDTVSSIEEKAQVYLDKNYPGTKIGDSKFNELVDHYIHDTDTPTAKKAREESDFGAIYCYMSLYSQYPKNESGSRIFPDDTYKLTLSQVLEKTISFEEEEILARFLYDKGLTDSPPKIITKKSN